MGTNYPDGQSVDFYGFEVIEYYFKRFLLHFSDYAVHIRILYCLILACIITMMVLFVLFFRRMRRNRDEKREFDSAHKNLHDGFYQILTSDQQPEIETIEKVCNMTMDNITKYRPEILSKLISEICMDLSRELDYIPNIDTLCTLTGVKTYYEKCLATKHRVLFTLQNIVNMHIRISEGYLAIYINHHNNNIRHMARMCHVISSNSDPYRYFLEDLNEHEGLWRFMMLHRLFGWLSANDCQMPQFLVLADKIQNEESVAFLIEEVAYWGSEREKSELHELFLSPHYSYRTAALKAMAILRDKDQEQAAVDSYEQQPESIRQEVLKAVAAVGSGLRTQFMEDAFRHSSSKQTREIALQCLYSYGKEGRRAFEFLRYEVLENEEDRVLMDQIDAIGILNQMRML